MRILKTKAFSREYKKLRLPDEKLKEVVDKLNGLARNGQLVSRRAGSLGGNVYK